MTNAGGEPKVKVIFGQTIRGTDSIGPGFLIWIGLFKLDSGLFSETKLKG